MQEEGGLAYVPAGHVDAVYAHEDAPATLCASAAQGRHAAEEVAPVALEYVPAAQAAQKVAPARALNFPAAQRVQVVLDVAPRAADHVPMGQAVALREEGGQKEPAGHSMGTPEEQS